MASELTGISGNISVPYDGELTHGLVLLGVCMDQGYQRMFFSWYRGLPSGYAGWVMIDSSGFKFTSIELKDGALNCSVFSPSRDISICVVPPTDFPTT